MKKLLAQFLICLSVFFTLPLILSAASGASVEVAPPGCSLPAPANFHVGNITSHSADLFWSPPPGIPPSTPVTYRIKMYDNTVNVALPDIYTTNTSYVYDGLSLGHSYTTSVSASACGIGGPFGPESPSQNFNTLYIIIVDVIAGNNEGLNICNQFTSANFFANTVITVTLPTGASQNNGITPIGHFVVQKQGTNVSVDFAVYSRYVNGQWRTDLWESSRSGLERNIGMNQATTNVTYATSSNFENFFLKVSDPFMLNVSPTDEYVKMQFGADVAVRYCGVTFESGGPGDHLVGGVKSMDQAQLDTFTDGSNERTENQSIVVGKMQLAPNPTDGNTLLNFSLRQAGQVQLALHDAAGRRISLPHDLPQQLEAGNYQTLINCENLPRGLYFLTLYSPEGRQTLRLVKE